MQDIKQRVLDMVDKHGVLIVVFAREVTIVNSIEAKRAFREFRREILLRNCPTRCINNYRTKGEQKIFLYGVTSKMKAKEEYLNNFLELCRDGTGVAEIIGITMNGD